MGPSTQGCYLRVGKEEHAAAGTGGPHAAQYQYGREVKNKIITSLWCFNFSRSTVTSTTAAAAAAAADISGGGVGEEVEGASMVDCCILFMILI